MPAGCRARIKGPKGQTNKTAGSLRQAQGTHIAKRFHSVFLIFFLNSCTEKALKRKSLILGPTCTFPCNSSQTTELLCLSCQPGCKHHFINTGHSYGAPSKMPNQGSETPQTTQCSGWCLQLLRSEPSDVSGTISRTPNFDHQPVLGLIEDLKTEINNCQINIRNYMENNYMA